MKNIKIDETAVFKLPDGRDIQAFVNAEGELRITTNNDGILVRPVCDNVVIVQMRGKK